MATEEEKQEKRQQKGELSRRDYAEEQFDRLIVYLASGALVVTIGFVSDIVEITKDVNTTLLKASWIAFLLALVSNLVSHQTTVVSADKKLIGKEKGSNNWNTLTRVLNFFSFWSLFAGLVAFIVFVFQSI